MLLKDIDEEKPSVQEDKQFVEGEIFNENGVNDQNLNEE